MNDQLKDAKIIVNQERVYIQFPHSRKRIRTVFYWKNYSKMDQIKIKALVHHLKLALEEPKQEEDKPFLKKLFT